MRNDARVRRESAPSSTIAPASSRAVQKLSRPTRSMSSRPSGSSAAPAASNPSSLMVLVLAVEQRAQLGELLFGKLRVLGEKMERRSDGTAERLFDQLGPRRTARLHGANGGGVLPDVAHLARG